MEYSGHDMGPVDVLDQMDEQERRLWLSRHVTQGKAYTAVEEAFRWLIARHREGNVLQRDPWFEPFASDREGLISRISALTVMFQILGSDVKFPSLDPDAVKHELRGELLELLRYLDRLYDAHSFFFGESHRRRELRGKELEQIQKDVETALGEDLHKKANSSADEIVRIFERHYRDSYLKALERSVYPGSPYLDGEVLLQVNYTDSAATLLRLLVRAVRWNRFSPEFDEELVQRIETCLVRTFRWLARNARDCPGGGIGWGWAGKILLEEEGYREEISTVTMLDAEYCVPQTYFTSGVVSALAMLSKLLEEDRNHPLAVSLKEIETEQVETLLGDAVRGLLSCNRRSNGDYLGWVDFEPYDPTTPHRDGPNKIRPAAYDESTPSLLETAYAICALGGAILEAGDRIQLGGEILDSLQRGAAFLFEELRKHPSLSWLKSQAFMHILSRHADGSVLKVIDECGVYTIFRGLAVYCTIRDKYGEHFADMPIETRKEQNRVYYSLAEFLVANVKPSMIDRRGFPALGLGTHRDIQRFPAIRATKSAVDAFFRFGIKQQVPGVVTILNQHLEKLKDGFILDLVARYDALESEGIRVAWGLIQTDGEEIRRRMDESS